MAKRSAKGMSISDFTQKFSTEIKCREYLVNTRWKDGFVCPKCGSKRHCKLSNGLFQCIECHHQTSATAGTFMHRSHVSLVKWFLALYFITQDKRGISATQLAFAIGVNYKTAWFMLKRIRSAMGQRDAKYTLSGVVEFDDAYIGGQTVGKKRGRGTEKAKVFVALSLNENGNPRFLKMGVTENLRQKSVRDFANRAIKPGSTVLGDECRSYIPALTNYDHQHSTYDSSSGMLKWLHVMIGNVKDFILGTYHRLPKKLLQSCLDEFCYRFSRRYFGSELFDRLLIAVVDQPLAESNG